MLKLAWNRKRHKRIAGQVGLSLTSDGLTLCHVVREEDTPPRLQACRSVSALTPEERRAALVELVAELHLEGLPCIVVLPSESYNLRLLDRPNVEDDEIASSLPWLLKDAIDFDLNEATLDYFDFPADATRGRTQRLFVAAVRNSVVDEVTDLLCESGLDLTAIDVAELALRNLGEQLPQQVAGTLFLHLGPKGGLLTICHESQLYFSRSISTGTSHIDSAMGHEIALDDSDDQLSDPARSLLDELLLEVQRSLDYYESELGKAPASRLAISPSTAELSVYIPYLTEQLRPVSVSQLDLNALIDSDDVLSNELQTKALLALGGALRGDYEQQINFKQVPARAPAFSNLPIDWIAKACAAVFCGLMLIYGADVYLNGQLRAELEANRIRHDSINRQLASLENQLGPTNIEGSEDDPLAELRAARDRTTRRLRRLEALGGDRREGFSKYFVGFARQSIPHLWLTRIEVNDGGKSLSIHGSTLAAKRVPQLLRRLRSEPSFSGKTFSLFRLAGSGRVGVLDFALESRPAVETMP